MVYALPPFIRRSILKKKKTFIDKRKISFPEPSDEIYPETKRRLIRPKIAFARAIIMTLFVIICIGLLSWGVLETFSLFSWYQTLVIPTIAQFAIIYSIGSFLSVLFFSKRITIFVIRLYQRYGPYEIRCRCLFIPNCSEYMILAINKYGLIQGIKKGIARFKRCHAPNGGVDYP